MAKQTINIGQTANDKTGDPLRTAFQKVNSNFNEIYSLIGNTAEGLTELAQDYAADMIVDGTHNGVSVDYDDQNNKINFSLNIDGGNASTSF
jgi:hypothetical protein